MLVVQAVKEGVLHCFLCCTCLYNAGDGVVTSLHTAVAIASGNA